MTAGTVDTTFYLQVDPVWSHYNPEKVVGAKANRITLNKPGRPRGGAVVVKLTVRLPEEAFLPLQPEAVIIIPADMIQSSSIEVTASSPRDDT